MENKVQLKEEELVGSEVVLNDIYPRTDTTSVTDNASGTSLEIALEHVWEAINNKLTRVVNSVNGRTGVVALDASDVGLSNVDNVSFNDIKQWTIDQLEAEFYGHSIKMFNSMNEMINVVIDNNDRSYENCAFYAFRGIVNTQDQSIADNRSYIGFFRFNEASQQMTYEAKPINVVGVTDESLTYSTSDNTGGLLKVRIHPDEKVLYLDPGTNEYDSGLRIDQTQLGGKVYTFFGAYYYASIHSCKMPTDAIGYPDDPTSGWKSGFLNNAGVTTGDKCHIYINEQDLGEHVLIGSNIIGDFREGDTIICHFNPYINATTNTLIGNNMFRHSLMFRQPAIGMVEYDGDVCVIKFRSIKPYTTWGITDKGTHKNISVNKYSDTELCLDVATLTKGGSASPINVLSTSDQYAFGVDDAIKLDVNDTLAYVVTPEGAERMYTVQSERDGGMFIHTDYSLCIMPFERFVGDNNTGCVSASNWRTLTPHGNPTHNQDGVLSYPTYLGINLLKGVSDEGSTNKYAPMSGLKVIESENAPGYTGEYFNWVRELGLDPEVDHINVDFDDMTYSGGLMINVGDYLSIAPALAPSAGSYQEYGKVNVRIGDGLTNDGHNRITIDCGDGLQISEEGKLEVTGSGGGGSSTTLCGIKLDDMEENSIFYNPGSTTGEEPENVMYIHLGPGLVISTHELDDPT